MKNIHRFLKILIILLVFVLSFVALSSYAAKLPQPLQMPWALQIPKVTAIGKNNISFVQITDIHFDTKTKKFSKRMFPDSESLLKDAIEQTNRIMGVDFVVFTGDVINKPGKEEFFKFVSCANTLKHKWHYAPGNHDVGILGGLSKPEINAILKKENKSYKNSNKGENLYYSYSPNNRFLIIFMDGVIPHEITANGYFPQKQLEWLENEIRSNKNKKIIIFQHFPVVTPFKSITHYVKNADDYLAVIDKYPNVLAVISGHYHAAKITQRNNVLHISSPALVEYPNAFRLVKMSLSVSESNAETEINLKLLPTNLKDVRRKSKSLSKSHALHEGEESDRNTTIIIKTR